MTGSKDLPEITGTRAQHLNEDRHTTPKGLRHEPHNRIERHKAQEEHARNPDYERYTETASEARKVGLPVGAEGTVSSQTPQEVKDGALGPHVVDTVVEGRLGGGEEVIYSPSDGPPLHQSDHKPRS